MEDLGAPRGYHIFYVEWVKTRGIFIHSLYRNLCMCIIYQYRFHSCVGYHTLYQTLFSALSLSLWMPTCIALIVWLSYAIHQWYDIVVFIFFCLVCWLPWKKDLLLRNLCGVWEHLGIYFLCWHAEWIENRSLTWKIDSHLRIKDNVMALKGSFTYLYMKSVMFAQKVLQVCLYSTMLPHEFAHYNLIVSFSTSYLQWSIILHLN